MSLTTLSSLTQSSAPPTHTPRLPSLHSYLHSPPLSHGWDSPHPRSGIDPHQWRRPGWSSPLSCPRGGDAAARAELKHLLVSGPVPRQFHDGTTDPIPMQADPAAASFGTTDPAPTRVDSAAAGSTVEDTAVATSGTAEAAPTRAVPVAGTSEVARATTSPSRAPPACEGLFAAQHRARLRAPPPLHRARHHAGPGL